MLRNEPQSGKQQRSRGRGLLRRGGDKEESSDKRGESRQKRRVERCGIRGIGDRGRGTTAEGAEWDGATRMATTGGTQDSSVGGLSGDVASGRGDTGKATSAAANKTGSGGRHGARPGIRGRTDGRRENPSGEFSGVGGDEEVCNTSGVAHKTLGVEHS